MTFRVVTYNVLATAYLGKGDYSATPPEVLDHERRTAALVRHVAAMGADAYCLQEVEADVFGALREDLEPRGYAGLYEWKGGGKADGCATFYRSAAFSLVKSRRMGYSDQEKGVGEHSGFIALLTIFSHEGRTLGIANTHLRWDPYTAPKEKQVGYRQAVELLAALEASEPRCDGWVVCGDFNRGPTSAVATAFGEAGFRLAHAGRGVYSSAFNRRLSLIDHLFYRGPFSVTPIDPPPLTEASALPSASEPSDHLAMAAEFAWG
jgi:mRNA deadenylase 3'-5' endonuclease subunit Ccr4